jgi:hypothetical protein
VWSCSLVLKGTADSHARKETDVECRLGEQSNVANSEAAIDGLHTEVLL